MAVLASLSVTEEPPQDSQKSEEKFTPFCFGLTPVAAGQRGGELKIELVPRVEGRVLQKGLKGTLDLTGFGGPGVQLLSHMGPPHLCVSHIRGAAVDSPYA